MPCGFQPQSGMAMEHSGALPRHEIRSASGLPMKGETVL